MTDPSPRACPVCGAPFTQVRLGATEVDVCEPHGVWLDVGELEAITGRIERRAARATKRAVRRASSDGKTAGWLLGPMAYLFD